MRNLWCVIILAAAVIALGCGETEESKDQPEGADTTAKDGGGAVVAGGPEATAKTMLDGFKKGDAQAFLDGVDLEGLYPLTIPEEQRAETTYEKFVEQFRQGMQQAGAPPEGFEYKIGASKKQGDVVTLSISIKESADADWDTSEVPFKKINGKWKITAEGFMAMMNE